MRKQEREGAEGEGLGSERKGRRQGRSERKGWSQTTRRQGEDKGG